MVDEHSPQILRLRTGQSFITDDASLAPDQKSFLRFCRIYDVDFSDTCFHCQDSLSAETLALANLKCVRTWDYYRVAQCVCHFRSPTMPTTMPYGCCGEALRWPEASRITFTFSDSNKDLHHWINLRSYAPQRFDSMALIYQLEQGRATDKSDRERRVERVNAHTYAFLTIVGKAWANKKTLTVVNAASLDDLPESVSILDISPPGPHMEKESAADFLRKKALRALTSLALPGPVCPVHFVTLEQYRAHVGEFEFAVDTEKGWIPRIIELP